MKHARRNERREAEAEARAQGYQAADAREAGKTYGEQGQLKLIRADGVRAARPLFQEEGSGSIPTSALQFWFSTIKQEPAKALNRLWHSRFPETDTAATRVCHVAEFKGVYFAVAIWCNPSSPKLPQLEWLMLKRWAIAPEAPKNTGSRMESWMVRDVRRRFPEVHTLVSYSDADTHDGAIYKACGWIEGDTTERKTEGRMKNRCFNKNEPHYEDYGGRGITVCERWRDSFPDFLADMGPRPSNRHELDRHPNNDGNYEPGNCRWAIRKQQARNRRSNRFVTIGGVTKTLAEWSELSGLSIGTISRRVELGWPEDRWLVPPTRKAHNKCKA